MKNIHILPTDKPSKLFYNVGGALLFTDYENYNGVNIYITNSEEIKEGDWYLDTFNTQRIKANQFSDHKHYGNACKKIILTTDQDLIKDGVQAIDDEFLEWFVAHPSCESVEVDKPILKGIPLLGYRIIIPQEEPKEETLEEAKLRQLFKNRSNCYADAEDVVQAMDENCFIETIKEWQQEQDKNKYSEEEVIQIILDLRFKVDLYSTREEIKEWFEQFFKKK
jgi:hypothetical protein